VADEPEEKPDGEAPAEAADESTSQETAVGHSVLEEPSGEEPARETAVGHQVVDAEPAAAAATPEPASAQPQPAPAPSTPPSGTSPAAADRAAAESHDEFEKKPEVFIGAAFVGAFVFGKLLKKLTRGDD
jgi:hypothetical protein